MQNNLTRGLRTVLWTKISIVIAVFAIIGFACLVRFMGVLESQPQADSLTGGMLLMLFMFGLVCFLLTVSLCIQGTFWLLWLFRSQSNLRHCRPTVISPWIALILSMLPYVGFILHFFVIRNLIRHTEEELALRRRGDASTYAPAVPMNLLYVYVAGMLLSFIFSIVSQTMPSLFISIVLTMGAAISYMKVLSIFVKEEHELFEITKDDELRKKVDQVLREREIEKAASEVQAASYEKSSEN